MLRRAVSIVWLQILDDIGEPPVRRHRHVHHCGQLAPYAHALRLLESGVEQISISRGDAAAAGTPCASAQSVCAINILMCARLPGRRRCRQFMAARRVQLRLLVFVVLHIRGNARQLPHAPGRRASAGPHDGQHVRATRGVKSAIHHSITWARRCRYNFYIFSVPAPGTSDITFTLTPMLGDPDM